MSSTTDQQLTSNKINAFGLRSLLQTSGTQSNLKNALTDKSNTPPDDNTLIYAGMAVVAAILAWQLLKG